MKINLYTAYKKQIKDSQAIQIRLLQDVDVLAAPDFQLTCSRLETPTRESLFCSGKVFEGVHSYLMDVMRKSDFAPLNFLFENYDLVSKSDFAALFNSSNF